MSLLDIRDHIVHSAGTWSDPEKLAQQAPFSFNLADTRSASRLMLRWRGDAVALSGPLRIRVTFQSENVTYGLGSWSKLNQYATPAPQKAKASSSKKGAVPEKEAPGIELSPGLLQQLAQTLDFSLLGAGTLQASTVYSYTLDIPAGQVWPFEFHEQRIKRDLANNFYDRALIEVAGFEPLPKPSLAACDLPCDLAVADHPDASAFFPVSCEPCDPHAAVRMPPLAPALAAPSADGGCVRTRFFNGMFITKEDLETEQRYFRVKNRLHNRASGQGVVWGFNVGKQGDAVWVLPGYGVDCCGNDLTITTVYKVDIAVLLRDPAAAAACAGASGEPKRMHLLLEYVECPAEPRPVHSDPCAPPQAACEPSRIRETVRLRLIPPREIDARGPLAQFLATAEGLRTRYRARLETVSDQPATAQVRLRVAASEDVRLEPDREATIKMSPGLQSVTLSAEVVGVPAGVFTGGTLRVSEKSKTLAEVPLSLLSIPGARGAEVVLEKEHEYTAELVDWRVESPFVRQPGAAETGGASYRLSRRAKSLRVEGRVVQPARRVEVARARVCGEPCPVPTKPMPPEPAPGHPPGAAAIAAMPPAVVHGPSGEEPWAELKAVALGILGAWLQGSTATSHEAGTTDSWSFQRVAAASLYRAGWLLLHGVDATEERCDVGEAVQKLLRGWCQALLYAGPICAGEPHGVVIGCTVVQAGTLGDIDPFGGRRYVLHWPLLAHWGAQFGLPPLDVAATRLFSLLCCVAALPRITTGGDAPSVLAHLGSVDRTGEEILFAFGTETAMAEAYQRKTGRPWSVAATQVIGLPLFLTYAAGALRGQAPAPILSGASTPKGSTQVIERYTLGGLADTGPVSLLVVRTMP